MSLRSHAPKWRSFPRPHKQSMSACVLLLTFATSACQLPWCPEPHPDGEAQPVVPDQPETTASTTTTVPLITTTQQVTTAQPIEPVTPTSTSPVINTGDLTWGPDSTPQSDAWAKPALAEPYTDPAYGTAVRRLTSADGTRFNRNTYSRRQAENADGTMFLTYHGEAAYHAYNRETGELVASLGIHPDGEPQWHPSDPDLVRHVGGPNSYVGDLKLYETNVQSGSESVIADLTSRIQAELPEALYLHDMAEGSPSEDGNRYAWVVSDANEDEIGLVSYDLSTDTVLGIFDQLPARLAEGQGSYGPIDWVSMSPSGQYVVAGFWDANVVFDADFGNERILNLEGSHSDLALQTDRRDAWVYIDFDDASSADAGWLVSIDLDTLDRTRLFQVYGGANTSIHISGKGYGKPGWVVVSSYNCSNPGAWTCTKVMAVELGGDHRVLNLAHTYNCGDDYWTETQASVNRDFTRVYFNSDGGSCGTDAEVYEISVPTFE